MKRLGLTLAVCLASLAFAARGFASCSPGFVYFGGHADYEYLADTDFAANPGDCPTTIWYYTLSSRGTDGICGGFFPGVSTYALFTQHAPSFNKVYQFAHLPNPGEAGYINSNNWFPAFDYEAVGGGAYEDTLQMKIWNQDTGTLIWSSDVIHGDVTNPCRIMSFLFSADLTGKNVRAEMVGRVYSAGFSWKVSGVHLARRFY